VTCRKEEAAPATEKVWNDLLPRYFSK